MNDDEFHVRILHEGIVLRTETLEEFADFCQGIRPVYEDCAVFYDNFP